MDIEGNGVVYYPSTRVGEQPSGPNDRNVRYKLVSIFARNGLWAHRNDPATFAKPGNFAGDKSGGCGEGITVVCQVDAANAPWG